MKKNVIILCNGTRAKQHGWLKVVKFPDAILQKL